MTDTSRLETFADGVFAIAITLLVLGIRVPDAKEDLARALGAQWPSFFAYVVSFLTIGIMWVQHHRLFTVIGRSNPTFAMINVIFLMFIAFVPYPTEEARAAAYALPAFDDTYFGADTFGPATGAAVPLDDYDMGRDYR